MKLTKDGQRVYDQMKREGYTDEEMSEMVFPTEYESEEEKHADIEAIKKFIAEHNANRSSEDIQRVNELVERLRKEDEDYEKEKKSIM